MKLNIQDTFNKELPADPDKSNTRRQVFKACYSFVTPKKTAKAQLVHVAEEVAAMIGLTKEDTQSEAFLKVFSGNSIQQGSNPYSMCYGGHQFGHWAGQLGDGRAINLMEVVHNDLPWVLQLKGAGETPYSRGADGLAVLRSSIREHLCSEAMHHLGVPTTRSLSLILSGDRVLRDMMYDGNSAYEPGAIVCRVAPAFIRFGNFQIFASRQDTATLKQLTDYTIRHFFPEVETGTKEKYIKFFETVAARTLEMVIHWQRVGFVHGVMNTDNLSILGLTIDYGPYGWLEGYEPGWTPNTTDSRNKRYQYGQQAQIALWNLFQLANALFPLVEEAPGFEQVLEKYKTDYHRQYGQMMREKIGLFESMDGDDALITQLESNLQLTETDMTIFFRLLANFEKASKLDAESDFLDPVKKAFYAPAELEGEIRTKWKAWFEQYKKRLNKASLSDEDRKEKMNKVNPKYVLRNYMAQSAIDAAEKEDYSLVEALYELLKKPYEEQEENEKWFAKRPDWARHKVGCSMLSCSS